MANAKKVENLVNFQAILSKKTMCGNQTTLNYLCNIGVFLRNSA
jgi:hypothetical protein